jgi:hypothetical protein
MKIFNLNDQSKHWGPDTETGPDEESIYTIEK